MKKISLISFIFFLMIYSLFAQGVGKQLYSDEGFVIVSPIEGTWANKQSLVLEVPEANEVFYSFSGSHPMESGFAYDGPVMIEAEGAVSLKIALVFSDGNAAIYTVDYTVEKEETDFDNPFSLNLSQPVVTYGAGESIGIPAGFSYRLGNSSNFLPGDKILALQGGTFPHRYLPCEVVDGKRAWRFVLSPEGFPAPLPLSRPRGESPTEMFPEELAQQLEDKSELSQHNFTAGKKVEFYQAPHQKTVEEVADLDPGLSQMDVPEDDAIVDDTQGNLPDFDISEPPFQITDWNLLTFTRDKLIYSIDTDYWQATEGSVVVDRSVGHTIYWQSVAYEPGNPVYSFYLPPKPQEQQFEGNEAILVALGPDFTFVPEGLSIEPVSSILIDAFYGETLQSDFSVDVYYQDLYQGKTTLSVLVDKCPPVAPAIHSSSEAFYNRESVNLHIGEFEEGQVFYSLEMIVSEKEGFSTTAMESLRQKEAAFDLQKMKDGFQVYKGEPLLLESHSEHGHLFHVGAFTQDKQGNSSPITWFSTIIDPTNFYVASGDFALQEDEFQEQLEGTLGRPFTSLQEAVEATAHLDFVRLHIIDMLPVTEPVVINSKCEIYGTSAGSGLLFSQGAYLQIKDGDVVIKNCVLELQNASAGSDISDYKKSKPLLTVAKGKLSLEDCEVFGDYTASGTLLSATDAALCIVNSGITLRSGEYGAMVSSLRSEITVEGGQYTVIAPTAVVFSLSAGQLKLFDTQCKVYGNLGRVAELSGVSYTLTNNKFYGIFENKNLSTAQLVPVWSDGRSRLLQESGNAVSGFPGS